MVGEICAAERAVESFSTGPVDGGPGAKDEIAASAALAPSLTGGRLADDPDQSSAIYRR